MRTAYVCSSTRSGVQRGAASLAAKSPLRRLSPRPAPRCRASDEQASSLSELQAALLQERALVSPRFSPHSPLVTSATAGGGTAWEAEKE